MMDLDQELEDLKRKEVEIKEQIRVKTITNDLIKNLDKLIGVYSGAIVSARSSGLMSACAQVKALLLMKDSMPVYIYNKEKDTKGTTDAV